MMPSQPVGCIIEGGGEQKKNWTRNDTIIMKNHTGAMLQCIIDFDSKRSTQEVGPDPVTGSP